MKKIFMMMSAVALMACVSSCNKNEDAVEPIFQPKMAEVHESVYSNASGEWEFVSNERDEYYQWDGDRLVRWKCWLSPNYINESFQYDNAGRLVGAVCMDSNDVVEAYVHYTYDSDRVSKVTLLTLDSVVDADYVISYTDGKVTDIHVAYYNADLFKSGSPVVRQHDMLYRMFPDKVDKIASHAKGFVFTYNVRYEWAEDGSSTAYTNIMGIRDTLTLTYGNIPNPYYGFYEYNYIDVVFVKMAFPMFAPTLPTTFSARGLLTNGDGEFIYEFDGGNLSKCTVDIPESRFLDDDSELKYIERHVTTFSYTPQPISR